MDTFWEKGKLWRLGFLIFKWRLNVLISGRLDWKVPFKRLHVVTLLFGPVLDVLDLVSLLT